MDAMAGRPELPWKARYGTFLDATGMLGRGCPEGGRDELSYWYCGGRGEKRGKKE
jgi:hypothetical protein